MLFPGKYTDGVAGFNVRVDTTGFEPHEIAITIHKTVTPVLRMDSQKPVKDLPPKYNVIVRAEKSQQEPNISCSQLKQQALWDFELPAEIDPKSLECNFNDDGFLILQAHWNGTADAEPLKQTGKKRRAEVNDEFNDVSAKKRACIEEEDMDIDYTLSQVNAAINDRWGLIPFDILHLILRRLPKATDIRNCALVNKNWHTVSRSIKLPAKLVIDKRFLNPATVSEFINVFQNISPLPFSSLIYACHDMIEKPPNRLVQFLVMNESSFKHLDITLNFRSFEKFQQCDLLDWITKFHSAEYLKLRIYGFKHHLPIAFHNFQMDNIKVLDISEKYYIEMRDELRKRMKNLRNVLSRI